MMSFLALLLLLRASAVHEDDDFEDTFDLLRHESNCTANQSEPMRDRLTQEANGSRLNGTTIAAANQSRADNVQAVAQQRIEALLRAEPCLFDSEMLGVPANCRVEKVEHELVKRRLREDATVLEIGARYGTTSCAISAKQRGSGRLIVVEPDSTVWPALKGNRDKHGCSFQILEGVIGTTPVSVRHHDETPEAKTGAAWKGYFTYTGGGSAESPDNRSQQLVDSRNTSKVSQAVPFQEVQARFGLQFDTLVVDCQGCFDTVLKENPGMLARIGMIIIEADFADKPQPYDKLFRLIQSEGFELHETVVEGEGGRTGDIFPGLHYFVLAKKNFVATEGLQTFDFNTRYAAKLPSGT